MRRLACGVVALAAACGPADPCRSPQARRSARYSLPYAGHWVVAHGDTMTLPQLGDRFRLTDVVLDTTRTIYGRDCLFRGTLVFTVPRESLAVMWFGQPEQAIVLGWPAELGPFAGLGLTWFARDSLKGSILFDERMGVQVRPGVTAQVYAGREQAVKDGARR